MKKAMKADAAVAEQQEVGDEVQLKKAKKKKAKDAADEQPEADVAVEEPQKKTKKKKTKDVADEQPEADVAEEQPKEDSKKSKKSKEGKADDIGKHRALQEVIDTILKGIADPEAQKDGKAFVPAMWATKFKPQFGPYKKFLQAHPEKFALIHDGTGNFVIKRPEDVDPKELKKKTPTLVNGKTWQKMTIDAWMAYCLAVPREDRSFDAFIGALPHSARNARPSSAPLGSGGTEKRKKDDDNGEEKAKKRKKDDEDAASEEKPKKKKSKKTDQ